MYSSKPLPSGWLSQHQKENQKHLRATQAAAGAGGSERWQRIRGVMGGGGPGAEETTPLNEMGSYQSVSGSIEADLYGDLTL